MTNSHSRSEQAALFALVLLATTGCGTKAKEIAPAETKPVRDPLSISAGPDLRGQIKVGEAKWDAVGGRLQVAGRIEADGTRLARVSAAVTGRIVDVKVAEGEHVEKGQVLATIYSTELSTAQLAFLKAHSNQQVLERAVSRAKNLLDAGVIATAELLRRQAEYQQASADLSGAREQLRVLGLSEKNIQTLQASRSLDSVANITASIGGTVLERRATVGQVVEAVEPVFVIADLSRVWLVADVPEQSAGNLRIGKAVEAEIPALPQHRVQGKLSFVSATVNPETRTVLARMNVPNPHRVYKPAMLATMTLIDGTERKLVVPATAVVREGNNDHVFVKTGADTFTLQPVQLGPEVGDLRVLLEGVREDDQIVLDGAFHLNNERKRLALGGEEGS